jgi:hypothetical protein
VSTKELSNGSSCSLSKLHRGAYSIYSQWLGSVNIRNFVAVEFWVKWTVLGITYFVLTFMKLDGIHWISYAGLCLVGAISEFIYCDGFE